MNTPLDLYMPVLRGLLVTLVPLLGAASGVSYLRRAALDDGGAE